MPLKPVLQALVLADHVYEDKATGKKIIAGTFNTLLIRRRQRADAARPVMPAVQQAGSPYCYISLTDAAGEIPLSLRYVDLSNEQVLFEVKIQVKSDDRLATLELIAPLPTLPTPHEGTYTLELHCGDEPLGSLRVQVREIRAPGAPHADPAAN